MLSDLHILNLIYYGPFDHTLHHSFTFKIHHFKIVLNTQAPLLKPEQPRYKGILDILL